jgi:hypothetical protein
VKIPQSVRNLYATLEPEYQLLREHVDRLMLARKEERWHYESRLKSAESFALKLETGRVANPGQPEDLFACTLVVERPQRIPQAEALVTSLFSLKERRPKKPDRTHLAPYSFEFDDLRLYVKWRDDTQTRPTGLAPRLFEVQVKTFLQHAWAIATHDRLYKSSSADWASSRIAFQVKAMLENAEVAIGAADTLGAAFALARSDDRTEELRNTIAAIELRWHDEQLPQDRRRLAENLLSLAATLKLDIANVWEALDDATSRGDGIRSLNLSPFAATLAALIQQRGPQLFKALAEGRARVFVPTEVDLPTLDDSIVQKIVRPPR